jgi:hypothetical protein
LKDLEQEMQVTDQEKIDVISKPNPKLFIFVESSDVQLIGAID